MPEGDSVFQLSRRLQFMTGRRVRRCQLRVPRYATADLSNTIVRAVWPYGKNLFMQLDGTLLHTHLRMEGTWSVHREGARWRRPGYAARVVLSLEGEGSSYPPIEVVGFDLGHVGLMAARDYRAWARSMGPDVLAPSWIRGGREEAIRRIRLRPERSIGAVLLDQKNLAGVGNEYRAEICFLRGIHPARPVGEVDVAAAVDTARRLMWANRLAPVRVTTGVKRAGETTYVFGRNHRPCRRCGTRIRAGTLGGVDAGGDEGELERVIWWCPTCQPEPGGHLAAS